MKILLAILVLIPSLLFSQFLSSLTFEYETNGVANSQIHLANGDTLFCTEVKMNLEFVSGFDEKEQTYQICEWSEILCVKFNVDINLYELLSNPSKPDVIVLTDETLLSCVFLEIDRDYARYFIPESRKPTKITLNQIQDVWIATNVVPTHTYSPYPAFTLLGE